MALIDKMKTVEAIATFLFINDAIRGPEPGKVSDYLIFAESMLKDIPEKEELDIVMCRNCRYRKMKRATFRGEPYIYYKCDLLGREVEDDEYCSWGERSEP